MIDENIPQIEQKEKIKLIKMSKGYNWELVILPKDGSAFLSDEDLERLKVRNSILEKEYGVKGGEKE